MTDEKRKEVLELLLKDCNPGELIVKNLPQYLYKYRSGSEWDLNALENNCNSTNNKHFEVNLPGGVTSLFSDSSFRFVSTMSLKIMRSFNFSKEELKVDGVNSIHGFNNKLFNIKISLEKVDDSNRKSVISRSTDCFVVDADKIKGHLSLKSYEFGDTMKMPGGTNSVSRLLAKKGVRQEHRSMYPVIYDDRGIVAVYGIGINMERKVDESTENIYRIEVGLA